MRIFNSVLFRTMAILQMSLLLVSCSEGKEKQAKHVENVASSASPYEDHFNLEMIRLPKSYDGHNIVEIYNKLEAWNKKSSKDQFETNSQYKQRLNEINNVPVVGKLLPSDCYVFS